MGISFSGVGSGLPTSDWIDALVTSASAPITRLSTKVDSLQTAKTTLSTVKSKFSSFSSSVQKFTDANIVSAFDLFARKKATVNDTSLLTASVSNSSTVQDFSIKVTQLATATVAKSSGNPGKITGGDTKISELNNYTGNYGTFSIYVNNQKHTFELKDETGKNTLADAVKMINDEFSTNKEVQASITSDGKFHLEVDNNQVSDVRLGTNSDTSNLFNLLNLNKVALNSANPTDPNNIDFFESKKSLTSINIQGLLVGNAANLNTEVTAGTFKVGSAEIKVDSNSTISSIIAAINTNEKAGATASYDVANNQFVLKSKTPGAVNVNIEAGSSNFTEAMGLTSGGKYLANGFGADTLLVGENSPATAGTFKIGNAEFTVDGTSTINSLIADINGNADAGVTASYDTASKKLTLTSTDSTKTVSVKEGTSNFTDLVGLTSNGNLATNAEVLGKNALFTLNGEAFEANTNTVTDDITGIKGLTLNLLGTTSDETGKTSEIKLNVSQNTDDLVTAIQNFIDKFNQLSTDIKANTKSGATLSSEYSLTRTQSDLRTLTTGAINSTGIYNNLAAVGITTGAVGTSVSDSTSSLSLDKDKLLAALADDPASVKALFVGDKTTGVTGVMQKLKTKCDAVLDYESGYFAARTTSFDNQIEDINTSITRKQDALDKYKTRLTNQFAQMDQYISQMKSQSSSL